MLNFYFICDLFVIIGNGVLLNYMFFEICNCEILYGKYIFIYYLEYGGKVFMVYECEEIICIEGGDEFVFFKDVFVVGIF